MTNSFTLYIVITAIILSIFIVSSMPTKTSDTFEDTTHIISNMGNATKWYDTAGNISVIGYDITIPYVSNITGIIGWVLDIFALIGSVFIDVITIFTIFPSWLQPLALLAQLGFLFLVYGAIWR